MTIDIIIRTSLYFLALINPASKVLILSSAEPPLASRELIRISAKASLVALVILLILSTAGHFVLEEVFRVEIYSLQIAGGIVLFLIGLNAIRKGLFFDREKTVGNDDISVVPLAAPMIAGPGTITAAISFSSTSGISMTIVSLAIAVLLNFLIMISSLWIGKTLDRFHAFGPIIKITGLVVAAVAVQMVLTGVTEWLKPLIR